MAGLAQLPDIGVHFKRADGSRLRKRDVKLIHRELTRLNKQHGYLTAELILEAASDPAHSLHPFFEWNDEEAAYQYRLNQARYLIRSVHVVIERPDEEPIEQRAFVTIERAEEQDRVYLPMMQAMNRPDYRGQLLARALAEFESWKAKYLQMEELVEVFEAAERVKRGRTH